MKLITAIFIVALVSGYALATDQNIGFQMRPLADENAPNATKKIDDKGREYWVQNIILASTTDLERAYPGVMGEGIYKIDIVFKKDRPNKLYEITKPYVGRGLEVILNGKVLLIRKLFEPIKGDTASVGGNYSKDEAQKNADELNAKIAKLNKTPNNRVKTDAE